MRWSLQKTCMFDGVLVWWDWNRARRIILTKFQILWRVFAFRRFSHFRGSSISRKVSLLMLSDRFKVHAENRKRTVSHDRGWSPEFLKFPSLLFSCSSFDLVNFSSKNEVLQMLFFVLFNVNSSFFGILSRYDLQFFAHFGYSFHTMYPNDLSLC